MKAELINVRPDARKESKGCHGELEREEWRDVKGYEGYYQVSSFGRVRSLETPERNTTPYLNSDGYLALGLAKNNKRKIHLIHRLVAAAFIPNPHNHPVINHRNEDKTCNYPHNLEWCTIGYNVTYGNAKQRAIQKQRTKVCQYNGKGELIKVWDCGKIAAEELQINVGGISKCHNGYIPCYEGFIWRKYGEPFDKYTLPTTEELLNIKPPTSYDASVDQYDQEGNLIATYPTIYEAERKTTSARQNILFCCIGKLVTSRKSIWRYTGDAFDKYPTKVEKRTPSEEAREKLRQYHLNSEYTKKVSKPVEAYTDSGVLVLHFPSLGEAIRAHGSGVVKALNGEYKHHHGLIWKRTTP